MIEFNKNKWIHVQNNSIRIEMTLEEFTHFASCVIESANKLIEYKWNYTDTFNKNVTTILYIPNNFKTKLINCYGKDWLIPKDTKFNPDMKSIL